MRSGVQASRRLDWSKRKLPTSSGRIVVAVLCGLTRQVVKDRTVLRSPSEIFARAGVLLVVGAVLWMINWWLHGRHVDLYDTQQLQTIGRPPQ